MAQATVQQGNSIGDMVLNELGDISLWGSMLDQNFFDSWTPTLYSGQIIQIPTIFPTGQSPNLNNIRALNTYPANNFTVPNIVSQINAIFDLMNGIS